MAKESAFAKNAHRARKIARDANKRAELKKIIKDKNKPFEERFEAQAKLDELPRDGSKIRYRNRCGITGRPRGVYRKFKLSRIMIRELAAEGGIPGLTKSSW